MKKIMLLGALLVLLIAPASLAQNQRVQATLTVADSGSCGVAVPTSGSSLSLGLNSNSGATVIQASDPAGTFTGTIQFQRTADGTNWVTAPSTDATPVTSATAPGAWQVNVAGYQAVRACLSNQSAGSLTVVITSSVASAATHGGSGSGSGTVNAGSAHQPAFYPADGTAVSGTCTVPATNGQFPMLFNVTADAAVDPSCPQSGFVNTPITGAATTYTIKSADNLQGIEHDVAGSQSVTYSLPTPTTLENLQFAIPQICNYSAHIDTLTPVTWTVNSVASVTIPSNTCRSLSIDPFNATNWLALSSASPTASCVPSSFSSQTDSGTVTWAIGGALCANGYLLFTTHGGSRTLDLTGLVNGGSYVFKIQQDGTGGEGLILGTGCTWLVAIGGAGYSGSTVTPVTAPNGVDILAFIYDGTNCLATFN